MSDSQTLPPDRARASAGSRTGRARGSDATATPGSAAERLAAFPVAQVEKISQKVGPVRIAPWPRLQGCLAILFASRSGSTYLARELECAFDIGRLRESLNPNQLAASSAAQIAARRRDAWFSFKAGGTSVIAAELCGFFDAYLPVTSFLLLVRRDIIAQAVSRVKAKQTRRFHSNQQATTGASYDGTKIAQSIVIIADGVARLRWYAEASGRPWRRVAYEDFQLGDFAQTMATCDALGIPRRESGSRIQPQPVERIGDATNVAWTARFGAEMDSATRARLDRYLAEI